MHRFFLDPSDRCFTRSSSLERSSSIPSDLDLESKDDLSKLEERVKHLSLGSRKNQVDSSQFTSKLA
jgi:hypothetical protein